MKTSELKKIIREELLKEANKDFMLSANGIDIWFKNGYQYDDEDKLVKLYQDIAKLMSRHKFYPAKKIVISDKK